MFCQNNLRAKPDTVFGQKSARCGPANQEREPASICDRDWLWWPRTNKLRPAASISCYFIIGATRALFVCLRSNKRIIVVIMSGYRNKLLIKLSQNNVQHYNNSNCPTMTSNLNSDMQKVDDTIIPSRGPGLCVPYEDHIIDTSIDCRNISPLIPLSESEYNCTSLCDEISQGNYTELLDVVTSSMSRDDFLEASSGTNNEDNRPVLQVSHDDAPVTNVTSSMSQDVFLQASTSGTSNVHNSPELQVSHEDVLVNNIDQTQYTSPIRDPHTPSNAVDCDSEIDNDIIHPKKKAKRLRNPIDILLHQKQKHPIIPPCCNCNKSCTRHIGERCTK